EVDWPIIFSRTASETKSPQDLVQLPVRNVASSHDPSRSLFPNRLRQTVELPARPFFRDCDSQTRFQIRIPASQRQSRMITLVQQAIDQRCRVAGNLNRKLLEERPAKAKRQAGLLELFRKVMRFAQAQRSRFF